MPLSLVYSVFLVSGSAALIYQVVWQRALFAVYGVNIESVTVVVTAFMLGLGVGSFAGGRLANRPGAPLLTWFGLIELAIAAYGASSLWLVARVGSATAGAGAFATFGLTLLLVLLPTRATTRRSRS